MAPKLIWVSTLPVPNDDWTHVESSAAAIALLDQNLASGTPPDIVALAWNLAPYIDSADTLRPVKQDTAAPIVQWFIDNATWPDNVWIMQTTTANGNELADLVESSKPADTSVFRMQ